MTDLKEIAKIWDGIVEIYKETIPQNNPKVTVKNCSFLMTILEKMLQKSSVKGMKIY